MKRIETIQLMTLLVDSGTLSQLFTDVANAVREKRLKLTSKDERTNYLSDIENTLAVSAEIIKQSEDKYAN